MPSGPATRALYVLAMWDGKGRVMTTRVSSAGSSVSSQVSVRSNTARMYSWKAS
jgi:hypothetical protein